MNFTGLYSKAETPVLLAIFKRYPLNKWADDVATLNLRVARQNHALIGETVTVDADHLMDFLLPFSAIGCDPVTP